MNVRPQVLPLFKARVRTFLICWIVFGINSAPSSVLAGVFEGLVPEGVAIGFAIVVRQPVGIIPSNETGPSPAKRRRVESHQVDDPVESVNLKKGFLQESFLPACRVFMDSVSRITGTIFYKMFSWATPASLTALLSGQSGEG